MLHVGERRGRGSSDRDDTVIFVPDEYLAPHGERNSAVAAGASRVASTSLLGQERSDQSLLPSRLWTQAVACQGLLCAPMR